MIALTRQVMMVPILTNKIQLENGKLHDEEIVGKLRDKEKERKKKQNVFTFSETHAAQSNDQSSRDTYQKRLRLFEAEQVHKFIQEIDSYQQTFTFDQIDSYLVRFSYFAKFSKQVRRKLMNLGQLKVYEQGDVIFR